MKKIIAVFVVLVLLAFGLLYLSSDSNTIGAVNIAQMGNEDVRTIRSKSISFLEDLQYKDFEKAASYHLTAERANVDIPRLLERLFAVKPEFLDIMRYEIKKVNVDRSGDRAKVMTHTVVKILNTNEIREPEVILYWHRDSKEGWVMKLESSLHG